MWKTHFDSLQENENTMKLMQDDNIINELRSRNSQQSDEEAPTKYKSNSLKYICFLAFSLCIVFTVSLLIYKM